MGKTAQTRIKNPYCYHSHLSKIKFLQLLRYFAADLSAQKAAELSGISHVSCKKNFMRLRLYILDNFLADNYTCSTNEFEVDESYFGAKRIRGKRGRGAKGKTPVFGVINRGGNVFIQIIKNCSSEELIPLIKQRVPEESIIHTDGWSAYNELILCGYEHYVVHHARNEFVINKSHTNNIESFWSYAKRRLLKFNGIRQDTLYIHLKETEFRFNNRIKQKYDKQYTYNGEKIYKILLDSLRKKPLR